MDIVLSIHETHHIVCCSLLLPSHTRLYIERYTHADVTDEAEVVRLRRLALQSLEQLQSFTSNTSSQRDWSVSLKPPVA